MARWIALVAIGVSAMPGCSPRVGGGTSGVVPAAAAMPAAKTVVEIAPGEDAKHLIELFGAKYHKFSFGQGTFPRGAQITVSDGKRILMTNVAKPGQGESLTVETLMIPVGLGDWWNADRLEVTVTAGVSLATTTVRNEMPNPFKTGGHSTSFQESSLPGGAQPGPPFTLYSAQSWNGEPGRATSKLGAPKPDHELIITAQEMPSNLDRPGHA